jgi:hypothetical protein
MTTAAEAAWATRNERTATPRSPFIAGYEAGVFDEGLRLVEFVGKSMPTIVKFTGSAERAAELLAFMFREMRPDHTNGSEHA